MSSINSRTVHPNRDVEHDTKRRIPASFQLASAFLVEFFPRAPLMVPGPAEIFDFGQFRLDTRQGVLLRGGQRITLIPKAIDLLAVLVRSAGSVVTKTELLER